MPRQHPDFYFLLNFSYISYIYIMDYYNHLIQTCYKTCYYLYISFLYYFRLTVTCLITWTIEIDSICSAFWKDHTSCTLHWYSWCQPGNDACRIGAMYPGVTPLIGFTSVLHASEVERKRREKCHSEKTVESNAVFNYSRRTIQGCCTWLFWWLWFGLECMHYYRFCRICLQLWIHNSKGY